jgi:hypothetical protein
VVHHQPLEATACLVQLLHSVAVLAAEPPTAVLAVQVAVVVRKAVPFWLLVVQVQPIKVSQVLMVKLLRRTTRVAAVVLVLLAQHPVAETVFRQALMELLPLGAAAVVVSKLLVVQVVAVTVLLDKVQQVQQTLVVVVAVQPIRCQTVALAVQA